MTADAPHRPAAAPLTDGRKSVTEQALVVAFMIVPLLALAAAVPLAWDWGLSWLDVGLALTSYFLTGLGVTVGFHRYFHPRLLQGRPATPRFSDKEGDPHSPWLFGTGPAAMVRGFWHSHMGWILGRDRTNARRFAPDLLADRDVAGGAVLRGVMAQPAPRRPAVASRS